MAIRLIAALVLSLVGLTASFAAPASACSVWIDIIPKPVLGWSEVERTVLTRRLNNRIRHDLAQLDARRAAEHQTEIWDRADQVFLARIEPRDPADPPPDANSWQRQKHMKPVRWLKGSGEADTFSVDFELGWCTTDPDWDGIHGNTGEEFVVFAAGGELSRATVLDAIALGNLVEPRVKAALPLHQ